MKDSAITKFRIPQAIFGLAVLVMGPLGAKADVPVISRGETFKCTLPMFGMAMVRSGVKKGHGYAWQE